MKITMHDPIGEALDVCEVHPSAVISDHDGQIVVAVDTGTELYTIKLTRHEALWISGLVGDVAKGSIGDKS